MPELTFEQKMALVPFMMTLPEVQAAAYAAFIKEYEAGVPFREAYARFGFFIGMPKDEAERCADHCAKMLGL